MRVGVAVVDECGGDDYGGNAEMSGGGVKGFGGGGVAVWRRQQDVCEQNSKL
jgi:hypothetical protein